MGRGKKGRSATAHVLLDAPSPPPPLKTVASGSRRPMLWYVRGVAAAAMTCSTHAVLDCQVAMPIRLHAGIGAALAKFAGA